MVKVQIVENLGRDDRTASGQANQTGIFGGQAYSDGTGIFDIRTLLCVQTALFCEF